MPLDPGEDVRLRAKYHDWCSAKIVEQFLSLSPEEVYQLAQTDEPARGGSPAAGTTGPAPTSPASAAPVASPPAQESSFQQLVQRVTEALLQRTVLPSLEEWSAAYREDPERFEAEMLGFWKSPESDDD
ncbi:MAG: hypothetical protein P8Z36_14180 [Gemmatimonadota bacterium]|jgi:hypothetical protein